MLRHWTSVAAGCLAVGTLWAAPNLKYVPENADLVYVISGLDTQSPAQKKWDADIRALCKEQGVEIPEQAIDWKKFDLSPVWQDVLQASLGFSEDMKTTTAKSIVVSLCLPPTFADVKKDNLPTGLAVYAVVENPKADVARLNQAIKKMVDQANKKVAQTKNKDNDDTDNDKETPTRLALSTQDGWTLLRDADDPACLAWRAIPEGLAVALTLDFAETRAFFAGKGATLKADSPLGTALQAPNSAPQYGIVALRDLASILNRVLKEATPEQQQQMQLTAGWALQTHLIHIAGWHEGDTGRVPVTLQATNADAAKQVQEIMIGLKAMWGQMLIPMIMKTNTSELGKWFAKVPVSVAGDTVAIDFSIQRDTCLAIIKECITLHKAMQAQQKTNVPIDFDDKDDDEGESLSPDEAEAILEGQGLLDDAE